MTHGVVLAADRLGAHIPPDGYSPPYLITMAAATALYGFIGLMLAFGLARHYFEDRWAFLATIGIWAGSSLLVYMYFNPSWSHAHSAFAVSLFLWYWHRTRARRSLPQWILLGLSAGLMIDVYYPNAILLLVPATEAVPASSAWCARMQFLFSLRAWGPCLRLSCATLFMAMLLRATIRRCGLGFGPPRRCGVCSFPPTMEC
jgi:hypothetical protein